MSTMWTFPGNGREAARLRERAGAWAMTQTRTSLSRERRFRARRNQRSVESLAGPWRRTESSGRGETVGRVWGRSAETRAGYLKREG
ncbi:MAG: hypothetical protein QXT68_00060 [Halobacteria archaeon]